MDGQINQGKQQRCCKAEAATPKCAASCPSEEETMTSTENWFQPYLDACNEAKKYKAMYEEAIEALKTVCKLV